ncbi:MAG: phosphoribosyltransferase family protein [Patescibacteria group bacterium]
MTETDRENLQILESCGAIREGHFVYSSGRHGLVYIDIEALIDHSKSMTILCRQLAHRFRDSAVDCVTGPTKGGVVVASRVAAQLSNFCGRKVDFVPTEKTSLDGFFIKHAFRSQISNRKILVVDDVLTTGGSVQQVIDFVRRWDGNVVGIGVLYNRGGESARSAVDVSDFFALLDIPHPSWSESECPACKNGIPISLDFGHGGESLLRKFQAV